MEKEEDQHEEHIQANLEQMNLDEQQDQRQQQAEEEDCHHGKWQTIVEPQKKVPLFMVDFRHCDSKKCTGKKMERFKLLTTIKDKKKKFKGVVLSAFGKKFINKNDLQYIEKSGICVIDCSWNRIQETREFRYKHERKLPFVVAGNPVNYGKPYQLSCAQALATALCAIGYLPQAKYILSKFKWADGFWQQNPGIQQYGQCNSLQEIEIKSKQLEEQKEALIHHNFDFQSDEHSEQQEDKEKQKIQHVPEVQKVEQAKQES